MTDQLPRRPEATPEVSVIIATRDRPELVREAIRAVLGQQGVAGIEIVLVFDHSDPDHALPAEFPDADIRVITNTRSPGLAGARNSGIATARGRFIAFCDDDDLWLPGKLAAQLAAMHRHPEHALVCCGIIVEYDGQRHERSLPKREITLADLLADRLTELHPSTFLFRAESLRSNIGLVSEDVPGGFGEDYELLLRTARLGSIGFVQDSFVIIRWHQSSFFFRRWQIMSEGLQYVLDQYPEFRTSRRGFARLKGQIAFAEAARGDRQAALTELRSAGLHNPLEPRTYLALLVALGVIKPQLVMRTLHRFGRGI